MKKNNLNPYALFINLVRGSSSKIPLYPLNSIIINNLFLFLSLIKKTLNQITLKNFFPNKYNQRKNKIKKVLKYKFQK